MIRRRSAASWAGLVIDSLISFLRASARSRSPDAHSGSSAFRMKSGMNLLIELRKKFWAFASVMGLSLSSIFIQYTGESVARVFFISAGAFGALSLYGYTTKKDLTGWGSFLFIGLIGILIASIVNIFVASTALQFGISVIGVLVFAGLTAYDTQRIKAMYFDGSGQEGKKAIMGALTLYLDFINLFIMLIQLFGQRR